MRRWLMALAVLLLVTPFARAHFIFIIPEGKEGAKLVFSDGLEADANVPIDALKQVKLWIRDVDGKLTTPDWKKADNSLVVGRIGEGPREVAAACRYGLLTREGKTFALFYYAKYLPAGLKGAKPWDLLTLDILPTEAGKFQVQFQGKPVKGAEVVAIVPGGKKPAPAMTDDNGEVSVDTAAPGLYGLRARHIEARAGNTDAGRFEEVRHYSTLVFTVSKAGAARDADNLVALKDVAADPAATKLLADARAARANWDKFPGFSADIEVNVDGKVSKGRVSVDAAGKVMLEEVDKAAEGWVKRTLASIVGHRLGGGAGHETPCAFADNDAHHPLGRLINVLNDELHSSYRIRDRQIMVVNRTTPESRFSITLQENRTNVEGKFLPASFVVHYWDAKSGELTKTEANLQTWTRVSHYDLPVTTRVITATKELSVKSLTLSNHKLAHTAAR
jgi:hypothetical protein